LQPSLADSPKSRDFQVESASHENALQSLFVLDYGESGALDYRAGQSAATPISAPNCLTGPRRILHKRGYVTISEENASDFLSIPRQHRSSHGTIRLYGLPGLYDGRGNISRDEVGRITD
jgi:hypothetical protein